jgi:hypothetical protein
LELTCCRVQSQDRLHFLSSPTLICSIPTTREDVQCYAIIHERINTPRELFVRSSTRSRRTMIFPTMFQKSFSDATQPTLIRVPSLQRRAVRQVPRLALASRLRTYQLDDVSLLNQSAAMITMKGSRLFWISVAVTHRQIKSLSHFVLFEAN